MGYSILMYDEKESFSIHFAPQVAVSGSEKETGGRARGNKTEDVEDHFGSYGTDK